MIVFTAKDPAEVYEYTWIVPLDPGDTIATFTATVLSGTAIKDSQTNTTTTGSVWVSGGTADAYTYFNLVAVTAANRIFRQAAVLPIIDRAAELLASFRLRYPALAGIDDGQVSFWLADAGRMVGTEWAETHRFSAKSSWAAHKLAESGLVQGAVPAGLTSFKSGTFSATVSDGIAGLTGLESSVYGREFMALRSALFSGPFPAWTPPATFNA